MYHLSVFIHIVSAAFWVGGMLFLALIVVPVARRLPPAERGALLGAVGQRFRVAGWAALTLLGLTGLANLHFRHVTWASIVSGDLFDSQFGRLLAAKLVLVALMLALSAWHDFALGPASARALAAAGTPGGPPPARLATLRRRSAWLARLTLLLALLVVALAIALVRGLPR